MFRAIFFLLSCCAIEKAKSSCSLQGVIFFTFLLLLLHCKLYSPTHSLPTVLFFPYASDIAIFFPYGNLDEISFGQKHSVIIV